VLQIEPRPRAGDESVDDDRKFYRALSRDLLVFAKSELELSAPASDGNTIRDHVESLARQGEVDEIARLANLPKLPPAAAHVWRHFWAIRNETGGNGFGPSPIDRDHIRRWERDEYVRLALWERRAIMRMDVLWLNARAKDEPRKG
jgi:hypothetical protein